MKKIIHQVFDGQHDLRENVFRFRLVHSALGYQPFEQFPGCRMLHYQIIFRVRLDYFEQSEMGFTWYYILLYTQMAMGLWRDTNVLRSFIDLYSAYYILIERRKTKIEKSKII